MCIESWFSSLGCGSLLLKGIFVGFSVAAPVGPIGILCIRQNLAYGFLMGILCGVAVSVADAFYSLVAALGANFMNVIIHQHIRWFYLFGGLLLIFIGRKVFITQVSKNEGSVKKKRQYMGSFFYTLFLTLASPMTTLLFIAMFTAAGVFRNALTSMGILDLVVGVFLGSMLWWTVLATSIRFLRRYMNLTTFLVINKVSGLAIIGYGFFTLSKIFS